MIFDPSIIVLTAALLSILVNSMKIYEFVPCLFKKNLVTCQLPQVAS